ncbi:Predicted arabinose efflux permease, MFS family [Nocardiopsis flavescens]|uniref:Predicted arabinose efflux permease, MFS family n=1 Tax=Nocardiopsis flavescens TaxID=758803 RepID=A0A1M6Q085_9ACTN|nr:Predicted arabinose efflux permease, MFS family [Nocardiopsis flavescens]
MPPPRGADSYRAVLRTPGAVRFFVPAMLGRLSFGLLGPALVLSVTAAADSYAVVGAATAAYGATATVLAPARARLIDRHGLPRTLVPMAALAASGLLALAWLTWRPDPPAWSLIVLPALVGAAVPPLGPVTRTLWSRLFHDRDDLRRRAYSLDSVVEEAVFLAGPLLLAALLPFAPPAAGLAGAGLVLVCGSLLLAGAPWARALPPREPAGAAGGGPVPLRALLPAMSLSAALGLCLGSAALVHVAFAERHGDAGLLVWFEAVQTAGGVLGGLAYGAVLWRRRPVTRLVGLGLGVGAATALAAAAPGPVVLCAVLFAAGALATPAITTAYLAADGAAGPGAATRAGTWVNTAFNAGSSAGGAAAGVLVTLVAPAQGYLVAALPLLAVPLAVAGAAHSQRKRRAASAPPTTAHTRGTANAARGGREPSASTARRPSPSAVIGSTDDTASSGPGNALTGKSTPPSPSSRT